MIKTLRYSIMLGLTVFVLTSCSEETVAPDNLEPGPEGWGAPEQQALLAALTNSAALANTPALGFAGLIVGTLGDVGGINTHTTNAFSQSVESEISLAVTAALSNTYEGAVGIQIGYDVDGVQGWFVGVIGWNGLNTESNSVSQLVGVYHFDTDSQSPPNSLSKPIGLEDASLAPPMGEAHHHLARATYWNSTNSYLGTSGSFEITSSTFSGSSDCSQTSFSCTYATGNMSGSFDFVAETIQGEMSWTQVPVSFSGLNAVRLTITRGL